MRAPTMVAAILAFCVCIWAVTRVRAWAKELENPIS
jgi:hypothetical protein